LRAKNSDYAEYSDLDRLLKNNVRTQVSYTAWQTSKQCKTAWSAQVNRCILVQRWDQYGVTEDRQASRHALAILAYEKNIRSSVPQQLCMFSFGKQITP